MNQPFTVLGAGGFIGAKLVSHLRAAGQSVHAPPRKAAEETIIELQALPPSHIVYCIGLTSDFRTRPFELFEAHVGLLKRILESCEFASLTYLSSTRVYIHSSHGTESGPLVVNPLVRDDVFALSKLMGESLCINSTRPCRIVRPSNVFGPDDPSENFLTSVVRDAKRTGRVRIGLAPASAKDYVHVEDVVHWIAAIAQSGKQTIYNVASGHNTTNGEIADALRRLGVDVEFSTGGNTIIFPPIDNKRVVTEFGLPEKHVVDQIPALFDAA